MARIANARATAPQLLAAYGFDSAAKRKALPAVSFSSVSEHEPRPIQKAVGDVDGQVVILEAETGSGKTEAALYRFARLFERGEVDGLYFALPTRVAAKSIEERIREAVQRIFPSGARPSVILAVPGYVKSDGVGYKTLPDFDVQWDDGPDANLRRGRWAIEHPKRFLAGTILVGTIDQALLGAIQARHAHMRSSSLLRHLLVVDEVHASDVYMERLLVSLLDQHTSAGGHALLLSATLGSTARHRLLGLTSNDDQSLVELSSALPGDLDFTGSRAKTLRRLWPDKADYT
ncbi:CRISPR-associated helicase Cas3, protein [Hyphomicrobium sulfonivorans]|uniref:CRISPR-associated helicase Cas3, protein n=1 Tax=Hyphomicrobium sulfonivorans TaxID=121290 RepID=A0A109BPE4_HYPSL|nr:DEAD/DEAH box helicase [Hyphomicrobium sulfonivorans]KWT72529.1 CRISPR-associated helicase Cas3, protein [Hyphomicrobium sulfonivorans]